MVYKNYMEEAILEELAGVLARFKKVCDCELCREDIVARALNRLPPRYVVTKLGHFYSKYDTMRSQVRADIVRELTLAARAVKAKPRHK